MPQSWSVYVELAARAVADALIDDLHGRLAGLEPAVGYAPNGNLSARVFIEASTARQATEAATREVAGAARALSIPHAIAGIEAVTEEELDRRLEEPAVPELAGVSEIAEILGVTSRQRANQITKLSHFPPPVAHLKSGPVYLREQVEAFGKRWDRSGGRPFKPVEVTGAEAALLTVLRDTMHDREPETNFAGMASLWVDRSSEGENLLEALFPARNEETPEVLRSLAKKNLLHIHDEEERGDREVVTLELTPRGDRAPLESV
ncbi:hypothetical protein [Streptomyces chartreusis]